MLVGEGPHSSHVRCARPAFRCLRIYQHSGARHAHAASGRASNAAAAELGSASPQAPEKDQRQAGRVRSMTPAAAVRLLSSGGWSLLDVRPPTETRKAHIVNAVEVPMFVAEELTSIGSVIKNMADFCFIGGRHMVLNPEFVSQVESRLPDKAHPMLVGCQKGLRSLAACEELAHAGYQQLAWINGGFDNGGRLFPTQGNVDVRHAGIGGLSALLGWTQVQRDEGEHHSQERMERAVLAIVLADMTFLLCLAMWNPAAVS